MPMRDWTTLEVGILAAHRHAGLGFTAISRLMNRSRDSVRKAYVRNAHPRLRSMTDLSDLAGRLSATGRKALMQCGDVADRFPCRSCREPGFRRCNFSMARRIEAADACEAAGVLINGDGFTALRDHLEKMK